jgi:hypothetical protein
MGKASEKVTTKMNFPEKVIFTQYLKGGRFFKKIFQLLWAASIETIWQQW